MKKGYKLCPFCANEIKEKAIKCQYCHEFVEKEDVKEDKIKGKKLTYEKLNYYRGNRIFIPLFIILTVIHLIFCVINEAEDILFSETIIILIILSIPILLEFLRNKNIFLEGISSTIRTDKIVNIYSYKFALKFVYILYVIILLLGFISCVVDGIKIEDICGILILFLVGFWIFCRPGEYLLNNVVLGGKGIYVCRMKLLNRNKISKVLKFIPYSSIKSCKRYKYFLLDFAVIPLLAPIKDYFVGHKTGIKITLIDGSKYWLGRLESMDNFAEEVKQHLK